jgi:NADPH-dependent 2,4-dienoyl-CoA reductase/sulfur reductase-like enzyme
VTADPSKTTSANKSRAPISKGRLSTSVTPLSAGVVVVGGGAGGLATLIGLRESGYSGAITILSAEKHAPIDRTKLSKALLTDLSKLEWYPESEIKETFGADLRTGVHVTSVNTGKKTVSLDGGTTISYDKLVLASGATPRRLPIPGANLPHVYALRGVEDAKKIDGALGQGNVASQTLGLGKRLVVIGSSFIGMELVVATSARKLKEIHVIGIEEYPFQLILGEKIGAALRKVRPTIQ